MHISAVSSSPPPAIKPYVPRPPVTAAAGTPAARKQTQEASSGRQVQRNRGNVVDIHV